MENNPILMNDDELTHWGIKGMRWGVRRYQRKDGSLTPAGERRLKRESEAIKKEAAALKNRKATAAKFERLANKRKKLEDEKAAMDDVVGKKRKSEADKSKSTKKTIKEMSDEELAVAIRRVQMEKQYSSLTANPEPTKKGNGFVKDFMDRSAVPAIQEAGKTLIRDSLLKAGKKYLGLQTENADAYIDKLGKEVKKMNLEKAYRKLKDEAAEATAKEKAKADKTSSDESKPNSTNDSKGKRKSEAKVDNYESITNWQKNVDAYYDRIKNQKVPTNKDYEKSVDNMLSEIDNAGWEQWYQTRRT